jgi:hypothetical protein
MRGLWRWKAARARAQERRSLRQAERAIARFPRVRVRHPHGLPQPLIVSLTSYPARYPTLAKTLKSLLDQDVAADRTILWLGHDDVASLPADVRALEAHGLEIRACEDMRSFTKLVPALQAHPEAAIVTADDDIYYPPEWLGGLVSDARNRPGMIVAHRCHMAFRNPDGSFRPYDEWTMATGEQADTVDGQLFPTGVGGVLYPPGAFDERVLDSVTFRSLCPRADDVWFFWMARLAGTEQRGTGMFKALVPWDGSQDVALFRQNWLLGDNDVQIIAMEKHFGLLTTALVKDRAVQTSLDYADMTKSGGVGG